MQFSNKIKLGRALIKHDLPIQPDFYPIKYVVEPINWCNLRCPTCLLSTNRAYKGYNKKQLVFDEFKYIIDKLPYAEFIMLQGVGEPLLTADLFLMIKYCKTKNIYTYFNTNGILVEKDNIHKILSSGLDEISFSINSFNIDVFSYTKNISKNTAERIIANLTLLISQKKKINSHHPKISIRAIVMKETLPFIKDLIIAASNIGVEKVVLQPFSVSFGGEEDSVVSKQELQNLYNSIIKMPKKNIEIRYSAFGDDIDSCKYPWSFPQITVEGYVLPCCGVSNPCTINFGNIFDADFETIWNSEGYINFRKEFLRNESKICIGCPRM